MAAGTVEEINPMLEPTSLIEVGRQGYVRIGG